MRAPQETELASPKGHPANLAKAYISTGRLSEMDLETNWQIDDRTAHPHRLVD